MGSLSSTLSIATQSLLAQETALSVTNNNIANANTIGYARETVNLSETSPISNGSLTIGSGVTVSGISSVQDELLSLRIQSQTSAQSSSDAQVNALNQIQTLFPLSGNSLASSFSGFFTSLSALSANPTDTADRQTVISSAQTLVDQFNTISAGLSGPSSSLNTTVQTDVTDVNQLAGQAATLNQEILQQKATGQDSGTLEDQLGQVELQLSSLTNLTVTHTESGDSLSTGNGTPLVLGNQSYALQTATGSDGNLHVYDSSGSDITSSISSGDLGGTIQTRDTTIPKAAKFSGHPCKPVRNCLQHGADQRLRSERQQGCGVIHGVSYSQWFRRLHQTCDHGSECHCSELRRHIWQQRKRRQPHCTSDVESAGGRKRDYSLFKPRLSGW